MIELIIAGGIIAGCFVCIFILWLLDLTYKYGKAKGAIEYMKFRDSHLHKQAGKCSNCVHEQ